MLVVQKRQQTNLGSQILADGHLVGYVKVLFLRGVEKYNTFNHEGANGSQRNRTEFKVLPLNLEESHMPKFELCEEEGDLLDQTLLWECFAVSKRGCNR